MTGHFRFTKEQQSSILRGRFQSHIHRFDLLATMLENYDVDEKVLLEIESRDTIFQELDYKKYR